MAFVSSLSTWGHMLRRRAKTFVGARPGLFFPFFRLRPAFDDLLVTRSTDLCVEGFPRSANSFAVGAIQHAQPEPLQIAHHTHVPANAMRACEWGIPTVVLIRSPQDAIVSRVALVRELRGDEPQSDNPAPPVSFHHWIYAWQTFYRALGAYRERGDLVVASFPDVITDMGRVVERVNTHFGTEFVPFEHTEEAVASVHTERGSHAGPTNRRDELKDETRTAFDERLRADAALREQMAAAEQLFSAYVSSADPAERQ